MFPPPPSPPPGVASFAPPSPAPHMSSSSTFASPTSTSLAPYSTALLLASPSSKSLATAKTPSLAIFWPPSPASAPSSSSSTPSPSHSYPPSSPPSPISRFSPSSATFSSMASPLPSPAPSASLSSPPMSLSAPFRTTSPSLALPLAPQSLLQLPPQHPALLPCLPAFPPLPLGRLEQPQGPIPSILANCSSLLHLHLQGNDLQGILPTALPVMHSLQVLFLSLSRKPQPLTTSSVTSTVPANLKTLALAIDHKLIISNGHELSGHVQINGSNNATLAILIESLYYTTGPMVIYSMPNLSDTWIMATMLHSVGAWVEEVGGGEVMVDAIWSVI